VQIAALVGVSVAVWVLLGLRLATAPEPFIPIAMVRQSVVAGIVVAGFFGIGTIIGLSIFVPLYVELVLHESASASGAVLIAFASGATLGSMIAGRLFSHLDRYKRVPVVGLPLGILGLVLFAIWPDRFSLAVVAVLLTFIGLGAGTMYPTTTVIIQNAVLTHQLGTATGMLNFFRQLGGALVVAVFGAIVLGGIDPGAAGVRTLDELSGAAGAVDFAMPFRWVFVAATIFLSAAFVAILVIEERPLRGPSPWPRSDGDAPASRMPAQ
jgi:MFS family permease